MDNPTAIIALSAIVLSSLTFVATQIGIRRTAKADYVRQLEDKVKYLEHALEIAQAEIRALTRELLRINNSKGEG